MSSALGVILKVQFTAGYADSGVCFHMVKAAYHNIWSPKALPDVMTDLIDGLPRIWQGHCTASNNSVFVSLSSSFVMISIVDNYLTVTALLPPQNILPLTNRYVSQLTF